MTRMNAYVWRPLVVVFVAMTVGDGCGSPARAPRSPRAIPAAEAPLPEATPAPGTSDEARRRDLTRRLFAFDSDAGGNWDVYLSTGDGAVVRNLTRHPAVDTLIGWSRDGQTLLVRSNRSGEFRDLAIDLSGQVRPGAAEAIPRCEYAPYRALSTDRTMLVFARMAEDRRTTARVFAKDTEAGVEWPLSPENIDAADPDITADGQWAVYVVQDAEPRIDIADVRGKWAFTTIAGPGTKRRPKWRPGDVSSGLRLNGEEAFPLREGNRWTYERLSGQEAVSVGFGVTGTAGVGDRHYAVLDGFFGDPNGGERMIAWDADRRSWIERDRGTETVLFGEGQLDGRIEPLKRPVEVPAGTFVDGWVLRGTEGSPPRDVMQVLVPRVGIVLREESTPYSRVTYRLLEATVDGARYPVER